jgi:hypothetical protein
MGRETAAGRILTARRFPTTAAASPIKTPAAIQQLGYCFGVDDPAEKK